MTRKSKPAHSCPLCKYHKWLGNSKTKRRRREVRADDSFKAQKNDAV